MNSWTSNKRGRYLSSISSLQLRHRPCRSLHRRWNQGHDFECHTALWHVQQYEWPPFGWRSPRVCRVPVDCRSEAETERSSGRVSPSTKVTDHQVLDVDGFGPRVGKALDNLLEDATDLLLRSTGRDGTDFYSMTSSLVEFLSLLFLPALPLIVRCAPSCRQAM